MLLRRHSVGRCSGKDIVAEEAPAGSVSASAPLDRAQDVELCHRAWGDRGTTVSRY